MKRQCSPCTIRPPPSPSLCLSLLRLSTFKRLSQGEVTTWRSAVWLKVGLTCSNRRVSTAARILATNRSPFPPKRHNLPNFKLHFIPKSSPASPDLPLSGFPLPFSLSCLLVPLSFLSIPYLYRRRMIFTSDSPGCLHKNY